MVELNLEDLLDRIKGLSQGQQFLLKDLYNPLDWKNTEAKTRKGFGRAFRLIAKMEPYSQFVEEVEKNNSNQLVYVRK